MSKAGGSVPSRPGRRRPTTAPRQPSQAPFPLCADKPAKLLQECPCGVGARLENILRDFRRTCSSLMPQHCNDDSGMLFCVTYEEVSHETTTVNFASEVDHVQDGRILVDGLDEFQEGSPQCPPAASQVVVPSKSVLGSDIGSEVTEAAAASAAAASVAAAAARALAAGTERTHNVRPPFHGLLTSCNAVPGSSAKPRSRNTSAERISPSHPSGGAFWAEKGTHPQKEQPDDLVDMPSLTMWATASGESLPKSGRVCTATCLGRQRG